MAKRLAFWGYIAVVHAIAIVGVILATRPDGGPFRMESMWTGEKGGGVTLYFRNEILAYAHVKKDRITAVTAYAPGDLAALGFSREDGADVWHGEYTKYRSGAFYGKDIGAFEFTCRDFDGDGIMETYIQKEPRLVKVLKADAWQEKQ